MQTYATDADLQEFLSTALVERLVALDVEDIERMLRRASELIDEHVVFPFQVADDTGLPTDTTIAASMRDACCAVVEFWLEVGEENDIDGLAGTNVAVAGYSGRRPPVLGTRALRILRSAGMFNTSGVEAWAW